MVSHGHSLISSASALSTYPNAAHDIRVIVTNIVTQLLWQERELYHDRVRQGRTDADVMFRMP
ncbi:hypothetical protein J28TS4_54470 [Paenibacillus lautus]|nr:hypothetical protein J28TS4_54470 [Paenibacillus lautus]